MSISKNWTAIAFSGTTGNEIKVEGEANVGMLDVEPKLERREPQGTNVTILQLDLLNAGDAQPENFRPVGYNERLEDLGQYQAVEIFHKGERIETIKVVIKQ